MSNPSINPSFSPHRSTSEGNVVFDDEIAIEQAEDWARRKAFLLRNELEPGTVDFETFFVKDSEFRKVYSFRPDPTLQPVLSKSQKRELRKLAKNKTLEEETRTNSSAGARPSSPSGNRPRPRRYIVDRGAFFT